VSDVDESAVPLGASVEVGVLLLIC
jgi:hypothetical protein